MLRKTVVCDTGQQIKTIFKQLSIVLLHYQYNLKTLILDIYLFIYSVFTYIYNCLCSQCLSPLMLWVRISTRSRCTTLCDKACQWLATGRWFSPSLPVSPTSKIDRHDINEILLKVALKPQPLTRTVPIIPEHSSWWWLLRCSIIYLTSIKLIGL